MSGAAEHFYTEGVRKHEWGTLVQLALEFNKPCPEVMLTLVPPRESETGHHTVDRFLPSEGQLGYPHVVVGVSLYEACWKGVGPLPLSFSISFGVNKHPSETASLSNAQLTIKVGVALASPICLKS